MNKLNIYLLDDEKTFLHEFHEYLSGFIQKEYKKEWAISAHSRSDEVLLQMNDQHPDLFIVDIELNEENVTGLDIAKLVHEKYPACSIVFQTSHLLYSLEVFDANPLYFILKHEYRDRWPHVFELFLRRQADAVQLLNLKNKSVHVTIPVNSVIYCEHIGKTTAIHTASEQYFFRIALSELLEKMSEGNVAFCHQSFLVNFSYVKKYSPTEIILENGIQIPIGRKYSNSFREKYAVWLNRKI